MATGCRTARSSRRLPLAMAHGRGWRAVDKARQIVALRVFDPPYVGSGVKCGHVRHIRGMPLHCSVADELAQRSIELVRCWRKACIRAYQMNLMAANGTPWACAQRSLTPCLARNSRALLRVGHTPA